MRVFKGILLHECMKVWKNKKFLMFLTSMLLLNVFAFGTLRYQTTILQVHFRT